MKLRLTTIVISLFATVSCDQKADVGASSSNDTGGGPSSAAVAEERAPVFDAEIFLESRSPEKGSVKFSGGLVSSYSMETKEGGKGNAQTRSAGWKSKKTEMEFDLMDGRVCKINPTFVEHREGSDVWRIELKYSTPAGGNTTPGALVSKEILFDGKSPAVVTEDKHHSILVRPATEAGTEPGDEGKGD